METVRSCVYILSIPYWCTCSALFQKISRCTVQLWKKNTQ